MATYQLYVTVTAAPGDDTNVVQVCLSYNKDRHQVYASAYPANLKDNGQVIVSITQGEYLTLESMARLNRKRLDTLFAEIKEEVESKKGKVYDLVQELCKKRGLTPV